MRQLFLLITGILMVATPAIASDADGVVIIAGKPMKVVELLKRQMAGGPIMDKVDLDATIAKAEQYPLGSDQNPVRVESPVGQLAYLSRLRCADGHAPYFTRIGNVGPGIYFSVVDDYVVDCGRAAPGQTHVKMDMYFKGHVETRPIAGFTIAPTDALIQAPASPST